MQCRAPDDAFVFVMPTKFRRHGTFGSVARQFGTACSRNAWTCASDMAFASKNRSSEMMFPAENSLAEGAALTAVAACAETADAGDCIATGSEARSAATASTLAVPSRLRRVLTCHSPRCEAMKHASCPLDGEQGHGNGAPTGSRDWRGSRDQASERSAAVFLRRSTARTAVRATPMAAAAKPIQRPGGVKATRSSPFAPAGTSISRRPTLFVVTGTLDPSMEAE